MTTTLGELEQLERQVKGLLEVNARLDAALNMQRARARRFQETVDQLEVAVAIYHLLADCREHPWSDCIELATAFTSSRTQARALAWEALTNHIDRNVVWSGEHGHRSIRFTRPRKPVA